jgi:hypothetical protein
MKILAENFSSYPLMDEWSAEGDVHFLPNSMRLYTGTSEGDVAALARDESVHFRRHEDVTLKVRLLPQLEGNLIGSSFVAFISEFSMREFEDSYDQTVPSEFTEDPDSTKVRFPQYLSPDKEAPQLAIKLMFEEVVGNPDYYKPRIQFGTFVEWTQSDDLPPLGEYPADIYYPVFDTADEQDEADLQILPFGKPITLKFHLNAAIEDNYNAPSVQVVITFNEETILSALEGGGYLFDDGDDGSEFSPIPKYIETNRATGTGYALGLMSPDDNEVRYLDVKHVGLGTGEIIYVNGRVFDSQGNPVSRQVRLRAWMTNSFLCITRRSSPVDGTFLIPLPNYYDTTEEGELSNVTLQVLGEGTHENDLYIAEHINCRVASNREEQ